MSTPTDIRDLNSIVSEANQPISMVRDEIKKVLVGQNQLIDRLLIAMLADGHVLLEGLPGLAKTLAINTLAKVISCDFKRIQFTPDLLPADLIGTQIYNPQEGSFSIRKGPIFTNLVLADEINRAPAKVQSALLEIMAERQVTIGDQTFNPPHPFLVLATQNPIDQEGTYPLPEAQTDRFMLKVLIDYPSKTEELEIIKKMSLLSKKPSVNPVIKIEDILKARSVIDSIYIDEKVIGYIINIIFATREPEEFGLKIKHLLDFGASPRASIALTLASKAFAFLNDRGFVTPHDVKSICHEVLRHRIGLSYEAEAEELSTDAIIDQILDTLQVP